MSIDLKQQLQPALQVRVTPKQIAANAILAMSSVQLTEAIAAELDENPALEMLEQSTCPICGSVITGSHCTECLPKNAAGSAPEGLDGGVGEWSLRDESEDLDPIARAEAEFTLQEHLDWTLRALLPARLHGVAEYAIGALDESGFLTESDEAIAAATNVSTDDVAAVREAMRGIEPIGVGSRNIQESLLAQIAYLEETGETEVPAIAAAIVRDHLPDLGERRFALIASTLGVTQDEVIAAWEFVKVNLHPYPTSAFSAAVSGGATNRTIVRPDVLIRAVDGELQVEVVESRRFALRVDPTYARLSAGMRSAEASEQDRQHVREYVGRARFFIDNVNRRRATLQRIAECLVERQEEYLLHGVQHLVPLTRAEVGALIGMHESTVSRATAEKYVMLPTGEVVPFGHFFTASLGVKDQIRKMIEAEEVDQPLSDQEIADRLAGEGVAIARRTVAKYRDELQLLPARLRRR
ncbi:MAG TPA: RNA polymerase factor sigma-54 [Candidatus Limnocylindria bacterium]|jgi:RNA polymerase sigma-54 factor|nr:RNA polymerase factor sigma-54 [Candidatus Limnocylindria bacterium]